jgi:predicted transcriptional regulator of viral defense system
MRDHLQAIFDLAELRDGFFTMRQAVDAGIPRANVVQLAHRGHLERVSRGVYRMVRFPYSPRAAYWEALLWPQGNAEVSTALSHETALLFHRLTDINPSEVHVTVSPNLRIVREIPGYLRIHRQTFEVGDIELYDGLQVTTLARTLRDLYKSGTSRAFVDEAAEAAIRRHLLPADFRIRV